MKVGLFQIVGAVVLLLAGMVIGGLGPRAEVRALQKALSEAATPQECSSAKRTGAEVANIFRGRPFDGGKPPEVVDIPVVVPPVDEELSEAPEPEVELHLGGEDEPRAEEFDAIEDAMRLRRTQTLAALSESDLSDNQVDEIGELTSTLNENLAEIAEEFSAVIEQTNGEPERRELMAFAAETLEVMLEAEDAMEAVAPSDERGDADPLLFDPISYLGPEVVASFRDLSP